MTPDIVKAIHDGNLFRPYVAGSPDGDLGSWREWMSFLRVLYGLRVPEDQHETVRLCTGREPERLAKDGYQECLLLCGRRSGKSKVIALVGAAEAVLSGREQRLSPGEIGLVAILSPTRFQSRIIYSYLKAVFDSTPLLRNEVVEEKKEGFRLKNGVEVAIITGDPRSCRGFSVIACIVDEIAHFGLSEESKVRSDMELIRALRPSLASTGGRLLSVGTPYAARGYAFETFKRAYGSDVPDVLCWNAPSLLMNPTLSEKIVKRAIEEDPIAANVEYCTATGLFREDVESFISRAAVEALVVPGRKELPPRSGIAYAAFCDVSGGKHDDAGLAIAHREDRVVVLDCLECYKAPHNPYEVVANMVATLRRYGCDRAIGDAYAAEWTRSAFQSHGIDYERCSTSIWKEGAAVKDKVAKPKAVLYLELLPRLHSGEVELLDNETLINQLASLQRRTRSGARDSIDHPPGGHDDLANVLAGVCDAAVQRVVTAGVIDLNVAEHPPLVREDPPLAPALHLHELRAKAYQDEMDRLARGGADYSGREGWTRVMRAFGRR
jgi:hypothetical protein